MNFVLKNVFNLSALGQVTTSDYACIFCIAVQVSKHCFCSSNSIFVLLKLENTCVNGKYKSEYKNTAHQTFKFWMSEWNLKLLEKTSSHLILLMLSRMGEEQDKW